MSHRERLIEGALECLQTKGYARTTARDIASAADASLASIAYHFGSKEALLNAALLRASQRWTEQLGAQALSQDTVDPLARAAAAYEAAMQAFAQSSGYRRLLASFLEATAQATDAPELRKQLADHYQAMRDIVAEVVRATLGPKAERQGTDPDAIASFLIAVYDGLVIQTLLDPHAVPDAPRLVSSMTAALARSSKANARRST